MKSNKFKIIIPVYNSALDIGKTLNSLINQTYKNWDAIIIDDASTDLTVHTVNHFKANYPDKFTVIKQKERQYALPNTITGINTICTDDEDIVIVLDGDDWFKDNNVLDFLNYTYQDEDIWATYGQFEFLTGDRGVCCDSGQPFDRLNPEIKRLSHLRTYKYWLFKKIKDEDFRDNMGVYFHAAGDVAVFYCIAEMAGVHLKFIPKTLYVYNNKTTLNIFLIRPGDQTKNGEYIQNSTAYKALKDKTSDPFEPLEVKLYDKNFAHQKWAAGDINPASYFTWNRNPEAKCPFTIYTDLELSKIDTTKDPDSVNIAWLLESYGVNTQPYTYIENNYQKFDYVLTYDEEFLKKIPNAIFMPGGQSWIKRDDWATYSKTGNTTYIYSSSPVIPNHKIRDDIYKKYKNKIDNVCGKTLEPFENKIDVLRNTRYNIILQNSQRPHYFTEHLIDCFLTGTIPIFWGTPWMKEHFNVKGMYFFHSVNDLGKVLAKISKTDYGEKKPYIQENFLKAKRYAIMEDYMYINILQRIQMGVYLK